MQTLSRSPLKRRHHNYHYYSSVVDGAAIKCGRDRGLDHVVEREKYLRPVIHIKNLINTEPSKSLPIAIIAQQRDSLRIPIRPIDFIRRYPAIFEEFLPGGIGIQPHIKLKPEVLNLHSDENLVYQSENYRKNVADRLFKLLMICRINKIPLRILDTLKFDLGLPEDYVRSIVPEFPDYFRVIGTRNSDLELVCWSSELAVSVLENKTMRGKPIEFPMQFPKDFEMDKNYKKWVDDWQKLPYVTPYENAIHLVPSSDESDRWAVAVMHEILNLFVARYVEKDDMFLVGEWLGIRSRFKRALLHHPGIFYLSSKVGTYTVVLREAFKRGLLIENNNPLVDIRNRYLHLMHSIKEDNKRVIVQQTKKKTSLEVSKTQLKTNGNDEDGDHGLKEHDVDTDDEFEVAASESNDEEEDAKEYRNSSSTRGSINRKINKIGTKKGDSSGFKGQRPVNKQRGSPKENWFDAVDKDDNAKDYTNSPSTRGSMNQKVNLHMKQDSRDSDRSRSGSKHLDRPNRNSFNTKDYVRERNLFSDRGRINWKNSNTGIKLDSRDSDRHRLDSKHLGRPNRNSFERNVDKKYPRQRNSTSARGRTNWKDNNIGVESDSRDSNRPRSGGRDYGKSDRIILPNEVEVSSKSAASVAA